MKWNRTLGLSSTLAVLLLVGIFVISKKAQVPGTVLSNTLDASSPSDQFSQEPTQSMGTKVPSGVQMVKSLLGLKVTFQNGHVNYPGPMIVHDPRFQGLGPKEKLVDAIKFQPLKKDPFLLLIAIGKKADGSPIIVPGRFDVTQKTSHNGFVLRDARGRVFYYSGYVLTTSIWKSLERGAVLQDQFCKQPVPLVMCSGKSSVKILLKKPQDPQRDIPMLTMVR